MKNYNYEKAKLYFKKTMDLGTENTNASEMFNYLSYELPEIRQIRGECFV